MPKKVNRGKSLLSHPHRQWYDDLLIRGTPVSHIYAQQTSVIPEELQVSTRSLYEYRNKILKPNKEAIKQYKEIKKEEEIEEFHHEVIQDPMISDAIEAKTETMMEADEAFLFMQSKLHDRICRLVDIDDDKTTSQVNIANAVGMLCDQMRLLTMDFLKVKGELVDAPQTQINIINIERRNAEMQAIKNSIIKIIQDLQPDVVPKFFQHFENEMKIVQETYAAKEMLFQQNSPMSEGKAAKVIEQFHARADRIKKQLE